MATSLFIAPALKLPLHAQHVSRAAAPGRSVQVPCVNSTARRSSVSDTAETQAQPPSQRVAYQGLWYKPPALAFDESAAIESELVAVGLGLDSQELAERRQDEQAGKRAELQWLPRGQEAAAVRDSTGVPSFDLLSLDFDTLYPEVEHLLTEAHHAELDRLTKRYFMDRVYNRGQILERCRRIYEMEPFDPRNPGQEALDLLMSFQQLNENHFTVTNMVAARAEERESQMGDLVRAGPIQSLPDATDLAIADIALYLEYERELLLQSVKEQHMMTTFKEAAEREREQVAHEAHVAMAETALREQLTIQDMALAGLNVDHVREALTRMGGASALATDYRDSLKAQGVIVT